MTICMLHAVKHPGRPFYLGAIAVNSEYVEELNDDPDTLIQVWWEKFHDTQPEQDSLFVSWLQDKGYAIEVYAHEFGTENPYQIYL